MQCAIAGPPWQCPSGDPLPCRCSAPPAQLQAFVGYRDVDDGLTVEVKDFVSKTQQADMVSFLGNLQATGGGDEAESVASGLKVCCCTMLHIVRGMHRPQAALPPD